MAIRERWNCPYGYCQAAPIVLKGGKLRAHKYEQGHKCPGSGYNIHAKKPSEEKAKMMERAKAVGLPVYET